MNSDPISRLPNLQEATRFWWIRHARVPEVSHRMYGNLDVDCDTSDADLFRGVASRLPSDALWVTSHLKRTRQTADALLDGGATSADMLEDADIGEMDFGAHNGRPHRELLAERTDPYLGFWPLSPYDTAPDGESFSDMTTRVTRFMDRMHDDHPGRDIVCVAHRGTILAALSHALQLPLTTSTSFVIDNVSLTSLARLRDQPADGPQYKVDQVGWLPG